MARRILIFFFNCHGCRLFIWGEKYWDLSAHITVSTRNSKVLNMPLFHMIFHALDLIKYILVCALNHRALKNKHFSLGYFAANNENCVKSLLCSFLQLARLQAKCIFKANFKMWTKNLYRVSELTMEYELKSKVFWLEKKNIPYE